MTAIKARLEALERETRPASSVVRLDLDALSDDDRAFITEISPKCETGEGKPDFSLLSVPELRRLIGIAKQMRGVEQWRCQI